MTLRFIFSLVAVVISLAPHFSHAHGFRLSVPVAQAADQCEPKYLVGGDRPSLQLVSSGGQSLIQMGLTPFGVFAQFPFSQPISDSPELFDVLRSAFQSERDLGWAYNVYDLFGPYLREEYPALALSSYDGALLVIAHPDSSHTTLFKPLGITDQQAAHVIQRVMAKFDVAGHSITFTGIPERMVNGFLSSANGIGITEDDLNRTYIYSAEEIARLEGSKFKDQRKNTNRFLTAFPNYSFLNLREHPELFPRVRELARHWLETRTFSSERDRLDAELEFTNLNYLLERFRDLQLFGGALMVNGDLAAYQIAGQKDADTMSFLSAKADVARFVGSYQMLYKLVAEQIVLPAGLHYIDMQADSGIPGLRSSKLGWNPVEILRWFIVTEAPGSTGAGPAPFASAGGE